MSHVPPESHKHRRRPQQARDIIDSKNLQILSNGMDSKLLKKIHAHRGLRLFWGLGVRGQHTKTTGRRMVIVGSVVKTRWKCGYALCFLSPNAWMTEYNGAICSPTRLHKKSFTKEKKKKSIIEAALSDGWCLKEEKQEVALSPKEGKK
ncbi:hypothetical protein EDB86DRAFT_2829192 [Lactarius hatsudake]|nr:hypothetical protein EDB86DRAFT_2829192 [Lactarius hatsudake]